METKSLTGGGRLTSRAAGVCGLAFVLSTFLGLTGLLGRDLFFTNPTTEQVLAWARQDGGLILFSWYVNALTTTLFYGLFIVLLLQVVGTRGAVATMALVGILITIVISWTQLGMIYAMVQLARQGGDSAGVVTLFKLGETMQTTDGVGVGLAIGCSSWLAVRARALPAVLGWYGLLVAAFFVVGGALQIEGMGIIGPIGILAGLLWVTIVSVLLLARPVAVRQPLSAGVPAPV